MMRRLSFAFMSAALVYGLSIFFAPHALAVNCDVNACISACEKRGPQFAVGKACTSGCLQAMDKRKKAGQCK
jgi:hypothetical protein